MSRVQIVVLLLIAGTCACSVAEPPERVVTSFYERLINSGHEYSGQPEWVRVREYLVPDLASLLSKQSAYEADCVRNAPAGYKPHMIDQNPFFFAPDGPKEIRDAQASISEDLTEVVVTLAYDDHLWRDTVRLEKVDGEWRVSEILWGDGGSLSARLAAFLARPCDV